MLQQSGRERERERGPHLIGTDTGSATEMEVGGGGEGWALVTSAHVSCVGLVSSGRSGSV